MATTKPIQKDNPKGSKYKDNWAVFNKDNQQHRYILSLCIQMGWSVTSERYGEVADLNRLSNWLKSNLSPIVKPLKDMEPNELSKIVSALESMNGKHHSK